MGLPMWFTFPLSRSGCSILLLMILIIYLCGKFYFISKQKIQQLEVQYCMIFQIMSISVQNGAFKLLPMAIALTFHACGMLFRIQPMTQLFIILCKTHLLLCSLGLSKISPLTRNIPLLQYSYLFKTLCRGAWVA